MMPKLSILFLAALLGAVRAETNSGTAITDTITRDEGVLVLTTTNFDDALKQYDNILVEFYAPWCGHCKALAPELSKAAQILADEGSDIQLAKVDATVESDLGTKHDVLGYPTLKFFHKSKPTEYNGARKADGIVQWLKKRTSFPAQKLTTSEELKTLLSSNAVAVVGYFDAEDSDAAKSFLEHVRQDDDTAYGFTSDSAVLSEHAVDAGINKIILFKKFDEPRTDYAGEFSAESIGKWIRTNSLPMFVEFTQDAAQRIFSGDIKHHLLLFANRAGKEYQKLNDTMRDLAKTFRDKALMVLVDTGKEENSRIAEFFGLTGKHESPTVRFVNLKDQLVKYKPEKVDFGFDYLKNFVQEVLDGVVKPHLMSQDIPSDWNAKPVKVLVGKNFDEIVFNREGKNVLVEFYAPWCGHCKKLTPIYDELAANYAAKNEKYVIAKMDATANELPHTQVQSFPTIRLYKAGSARDEFVEYNGERTLSGMTKFLESGGEYGRAAPGFEDDEGDDDDDDDNEDDGDDTDAEEGRDSADHKHVEL